MTALPASAGLPLVMLRAARLLAHDLVAVILTSTVMTVLMLPLVLGVLTGTPLLAAAGAAPFALATAIGAARGAQTELDERARLTAFVRVDAVLAALIAAPLAGGVLLVAAGNPLTLTAGCVLLSVTLLLAPLAAAYGALRDRRGFAAARGGLLLAAARPGAAVTVLATSVILVFGVVATAGVATLVAPGACSLLAVCVVGRALDDLASGWRP